MVRKAMEVPQVQFPNKVDEMPVGMQRQIPMVPTVQKTMETPQSQCIGEMVDVPAEVAVQAPHAHAVEKTVEGPQLQIVKETAKIPETQMIQGTQTSESLGKAPVSEKSTRPVHRQSRGCSRGGTETGPIRSEGSEDCGDAKGADLGRTRGHASRRTTSGAHDPERAEDCGGAADPVH